MPMSDVRARLGLRDAANDFGRTWFLTRPPEVATSLMAEWWAENVTDEVSASAQADFMEMMVAAFERQAQSRPL